jgi:VWFA-related protein
MVSAIATARVLSQQATQSPQPQPQPQSQPTFRVGATYVRVDAYVTQDGKPVTDLKPEELEVYEDGVRQTIRNFELVSVPQGNLQTAPRTDPKTVAEMRERVADPRRRVFVLFLDSYNSQLGSSMSARKAFKKFVEELVGPEDLIAGMTPEMSPEALTFGSRTEALDSFLDSIWGRRDSIRQDNEEEFMQGCFNRPDLVPLWPLYRERRRVKLTLDAVEALVQHVGDLREERKAIITVSEGWALYAEDNSLMNKLDPNGNRPLHTGPVVKRPIERDTNPTSGECDAVFLQLSQMETIHQFRDLPDKANRANASFYLIDPRGLPASDNLLGSSSVQADFNALRNKQENMRELANRTDGMALYHSNDLNAELKKISQDLSSYYLFGYDSTNSKLDGTYRALTVKVKRPGLQVRARKGYRAAVLPSAGSSNSRSGGTPNNPAGNEIESAIGSIMSTRADRLRLEALSRVPADQVKVTAVDLKGQPLTLPITVTDRLDGGATIIVADI